MENTKRLAKEGIKQNYSGADYYDLVIIGSGVTGLSSGLMWLKNTRDKKTLILEKNPYPGGYITAFRRGAYVFETTQLFPDVVDILDYLGLEIKLKPYTGTFMRRLVVDGDEVDEYRIPVGPDNFTDYLCEEFPEDAAKIRKLMAYEADLFRQVRKLKVLPSLGDKLRTPFIAPKVVANLNRTYAGLLDRFNIKDIKLREVLETFTAFSGVPASRASAIVAAGARLSSMTRCFRPYGYYDEFPAKMSELFQKLGGEMRFKAEVERIVVKDGRVSGVMIKGDGGMIRAGAVITTVDPNVGMKRLLGEENLSADYRRRLAGVVMSASSINVALGLDDRIDMTKMDLEPPYNVISTGLGTSEKLFDASQAGGHAFSKDCFHMAVLSPSLVTGPPNTVTIRGVPFGLGEWANWREKDQKRYKEEKEKWAKFFVEIIERHFIPNLSKHIKLTDVSTPATYARYSGSPTASIYDMAALVTQFGPKRLPMKTPVANLYQPKFAHGIYGGMMNGVQVVDMMLDGSFNGGNSLFVPK